MSTYCKIARDGHLLTVTINRPEVYNALHPMVDNAPTSLPLRQHVVNHG